MRTDIPVYERRLIKGLLQARPSLESGTAAASLLTRDIELISDARRVDGDLWPCIWALSATLSRQFRGSVYINCGLTTAPAAPVPLPRNCVFGRSRSNGVIRIGVGTNAEDATFVADARGSTIAFGKLIADSEARANPVSCFAIAGYVGFAAMAACAQIPAFRESFCVSQITLPNVVAPTGLDGLTLIGLGQLGQAYLALLYFLRPDLGTPDLFLIDKDRFELPNRDTQVLLSGKKWNGELKSEYLEAWAQSAGFPCQEKTITINWGWQPPLSIPSIALLGLDDLDVRRMCAIPSFAWLIEAGVGTSFAEPRVTWHSLPSSASISRQLFSVSQRSYVLPEDRAFAKKLKRTPGQCGWVTFKNIRATAPSMGLVAAAYAFTELFSYLTGNRSVAAGSAYLWSPLLPFLVRKREANLHAIQDAASGFSLFDN
jgi:hypothetical protein